MKILPQIWLFRRDAYALPTVMIFSVILIIAGLTFFAMASYETRGAIYRDNSSKAFYLADGAIERVRAKFLQDRAWRAGWSAEAVKEGAAAYGTYDLTVRDTTYQSYSNVVFLRATGHVKNANRRIEVMAQVPPTAFELPILVMGDADIGGNLCINGGQVHINGDAGSPHITCDGTYTDGFYIAPPPIYTDPAHFPGATYYYVRGNKVGAVWQAKIRDRNGVDITGTNNMTDVLTYNAGTTTFTFNFNNALVAKYFGEAYPGGCVFKRNPGDTSVVVNFGEVPEVDPPGVSGVSAVNLEKGVDVRPTIINTRFVGVTEAERLDWSFWRGALVTIKQITLLPRNGIAGIVWDFQKVGGAQARIGSAATPALLYVTRDVVDLNSNFDMYGSVICLRDWHNTGGPNVTYNAGFIPNLPSYLQQGWPGGVSGTLKILRWCEVATAGI